VLEKRFENAIPFRLLERDIDNMRSREGVKRAVVSVLRELGYIPEGPNHAGRKPNLRVIDGDPPDNPEDDECPEFV
jgi:hypothetical protein